GTAAYLLIRELRRDTLKVLVGILAALLVVGFGISREYLGVHYPTDVLAGWTLGVFWLGVIVATNHVWAMRALSSSTGAHTTAASIHRRDRWRPDARLGGISCRHLHRDPTTVSRGYACDDGDRARAGGGYGGDPIAPLHRRADRTIAGACEPGVRWDTGATRGELSRRWLDGGASVWFQRGSGRRRGGDQAAQRPGRAGHPIVPRGRAER